MDGNGGNTEFIIFLISSFVFAAVVIMKRDSLPERLRRPLALIGIFLVAVSFILLTISFYRAGT
ncbi:hypothetical protein [Marinicrinis sediminis]|uniref:Signal transduction histidine kinase n=1 Tax=Marinicrinis sediminis TaxID=1652465 RepID=A0ABW5R9L7_9BACL